MLLEQLNDISTYKHFTGRRDILEEIHQTVSEKKSLVIKGTSGSGKTALTLQMITALKKKQFSLIVNTGKTHPEILLKKIAAKAIKKGIKDADNREITGSDTRQQILWFVENYLKKEKIMILFDDFHANLDNDGKFQSGRLKEFLLYLKDNLENADTFMLFASETDIPGFEALWLTAFSDEEYKKFLAGTNRLKQLSGKSREQMKFDIGCNPRSLILMDRIAAREFGQKKFQWDALKKRVPKLDERILYKDSGEADFTPLMLERIWTYCSPAQLDLLKALSVYNRPVPVEALKAFELSISVADRKHLEELSLIDYSHQSGLYMIHPSTARYTRGHFSEKERKHVNISAAQYLTVSPTDPAFDVETAIEARNLYLEANEWEKAADLSLELESYLTATLRPQLAFDLLLEIEDKNCNKESRLRILRRLDFYYTIFGQMDKAITVNETLIKLHEESGDQKGIALCHRQLANAYDNKRKFDTALEHYDLAVSIFRELGENQAASFCLLQVGKILRKRGKYDEAVESYKKSEQLARTVGDDKGVTECLSHLGRACEERGQWDDALDYYNRCRQLLEKLDDQKEIASILHRLGNVYFLMGNFDEAFNYYTSSFETSERINDFHGMGYSLGQLGMIHQRRGREADALSHYTRSMEIFRKIEDRKGMASTLHQLGRISQSSGQLDEALAKYTESLSIREEDTDMPGMALTHGQLGMLHYDRQEYEEALRSSLKAFLLFSKLNAPGVQLARKNILKVQPHLPEEKFKEIMKEFNIDFQAPATQ